MKKSFFLFGFIVTASISFAQTPTWTWAQSAGGSLWDDGNAIAIDLADNIYVAGFFSSDSITFGSITLHKQGIGDFFLTKYDTNGTVIWAKQSLGTGQEIATGVSTDSLGNIYVCGWFDSPVMTIGSYTVTKSSGVSDADLFIAKYDASGNPLWLKNAGCYSSGTTLANSISSDAAGNTFIAGEFYDGNLTIGTTTLTNVGGPDVFLAKYDNNGNPIWAKMAGGTGEDKANSVTVDALNNVYISGAFDSDILFGTTTLTNNNAYDLFIAKYNSIGTLIWARGFGGNSDDWPIGIKTNASNEVFVTGGISSNSVIFDTITFTNPTFGKSDIFIAKFDSLGNTIWVKGVNNTNDGAGDSGVSIDFDNSGNIYVTGIFSCSSLTFNATTISNSGGFMDIFVVKYDSAGQEIWAVKAGGVNGADNPRGIVVDASGNSYICGLYYSNPINFGTFSYPNAGSNGFCDVFIAKIGETTTGINSFVLKTTNISVYPNPANENLNIVFDNNQNNTQQVLIFNSLGILAKEFYMTQSSQINIADLPSGLYFIHFKNSQQQSLRFIKQ